MLYCKIPCKQFAEVLLTGLSLKNNNNNKKRPFSLDGGYFVHYPSTIFRNIRSFENWGYYPVLLGITIRSFDAFRPIAREQKYSEALSSKYALKGVIVQSFSN